MAIGKSEWRYTLTAPDRDAADREGFEHLTDTNRIIALARAGSWPPVDDAEIEDVAFGWWWLSQAQREPVAKSASLNMFDAGEWALSSDDELAGSVDPFLAGPRRWPAWVDAIAEGLRERGETVLSASQKFAANFDALKRLRRECRILHHEAAGGYRGEIKDRSRAMRRIAAAIGNTEIDPRRIAAVLDRLSMQQEGLPIVPPLASIDACDGATGLDRLVAPAQEQLQQQLLVDREFL